MIRITSICPTCMSATPVLPPLGESVTCHRCREEREVRPSAALREDRIVDVCPLCGCGHLYVEKDFPAVVGLSVLVAGVVGFLVATLYDIVLALGILLGLAGVDALLYFFLPFRTICYRCLSVYRGVRRNPEHSTYELGTAGRFTDDYEEKRARERS